MKGLSIIRSGRTAVLWLALSSLGACAQPTHRGASPDGYDFNNYQRYAMPDVLHEISGIAFRDGDPGMLYAEQDEEGKVYTLRPGDKKAAHVRFGAKGDYEDMALANGFVVMLRSDGVLFDFPLKEFAAGEITDARKWEGLLPKGEYESLYADPHTGTLTLLAKHTKEDDRTGNVSGFSLRLAADGVITPLSRFTFDTDSLKSYKGMHHALFRPSGLSRDPRSGRWFILSSVNKMLVVADASWRVLQVCPLDPALFIQPEGIAFDRSENLYISNEGNKTTPGTVLRFLRR